MEQVTVSLITAVFAEASFTVNKNIDHAVISYRSITLSVITLYKHYFTVITSNYPICL